jgi:hypothetical protein
MLKFCEKCDRGGPLYAIHLHTTVKYCVSTETCRPPKMLRKNTTQPIVSLMLSAFAHGSNN